MISPKGADNYHEHVDARILWTLDERFIRLDTACRIDSTWSRKSAAADLNIDLVDELV